jgi:hypothetical protein
VAAPLCAKADDKFEMKLSLIHASPVRRIIQSEGRAIVHLFFGVEMLDIVK